MDLGTGTGFEGTPPAASPTCSDGAHGSSTGSTAPAAAAGGAETPPASTTPAALSLSMRRLAIANAAANSSSGGNGNGNGDDDDSAAASVEILSKVASFLSPGKTLHDVCMLAADRSDAAYIRQEYLKDNEEYVIWSLRALEEKLPVAEWPHSSPELMDSLSTHRRHFVKCRDNIVAWMEVNTDWRDWCHIRYLTLCRPMRAPSRSAFMALKKRQLRRWRPWWHDWEPDTLDWTSYEEHCSEVEPLCSVVSVFNNPALAVELGLCEVIQHQVQLFLERHHEIQAREGYMYQRSVADRLELWRGFCRWPDLRRPVDIFELALRRGDKASVEFLFSSAEHILYTKEENAATSFDCFSPRNEETVAEALASATSLSSVDIETFNTAICLPAVDINSNTFTDRRNERVSSILHLAIISTIDLIDFRPMSNQNVRELQLRAEKICALVDAGADVHKLGLPWHPRLDCSIVVNKPISPLGYAKEISSSGLWKEDYSEAFEQLKEFFLDVIIKKMESVDPQGDMLSL